MASTTRAEELAARLHSPGVAMDAKLMVAGNFQQQLMDLLNKEDVMAMVVVTAKSNKPASTAEPTPATINPLLLASACFGSSKALTFLINREDAQEPPMVMPTQAFLDLLMPGGMELRPASSYEEEEEEEGAHQPPLPAAPAPLLAGINVEGDTALHVVASHGDGPKFLECAKIIYHRAKHLLFAPNNKGDTPLHCAARAGQYEMVSCLIELAGYDRQQELLRKENELKETALHQAVRIGDEKIVKLLMLADPELANYPQQGTSPMYLAIILLEKDINIAQTLHDVSKGNISYSGPDGQNALHAAVLRCAVMTEKLLRWNKSLTTQSDINGSTPLHFASSLHYRAISYEPPQNYRWTCFKKKKNYRWTIDFIWHSKILKQVFQANPAAVYQADNSGLFPIHVAASVDVRSTIEIFLDKCPSSAGLRDAKGRTFLHVAVEKRILGVVSFVCLTPSLAWILNMQDNDGNTALHLAVQAGKLRMFCALFANQKVQLNLANENRQTPLDLSRSKLPSGRYHTLISENLMYWALKTVGAKHNALRWDHIEEKHSRHLNPEDEKKESEKVKDATQTLIIGSVLIATMAFGATFAIPGGYVADDHTNGGTPTLAGRYTFDAFIMANTLAFICSSVATIGFMFSGTSLVDLVIRGINLSISVFFMTSSLTSLAAAFALGVYVVLAPVAHNTAIAICVISPLVVLSRNIEFLVKWFVLVKPLCIRMGPIRAPMVLALWMSLQMLVQLWPFIVIFGWAALARMHQRH